MELNDGRSAEHLAAITTIRERLANLNRTKHLYGQHNALYIVAEDCTYLLSLVEALREALREQWEINHYEHCTNEWPHEEMERCHWPLPAILRPQTESPVPAAQALPPAIQAVLDAVGDVGDSPGHGLCECGNGMTCQVIDLTTERAEDALMSAWNRYLEWFASSRPQAETGTE